jgi:hypothetical protein
MGAPEMGVGEPGYGWRIGFDLPRRFAHRDLDAVVNLSRIKYLEKGAAYGNPRQEPLNGLIKQFQQLFADPKFAMKPLEEKGLRLHRHARGKTLGSHE